MLSVEEARNAILAQVSPLPVKSVATGASLGLILGEDVSADLDSPPFSKSLVDGYAVRSADLESGDLRLRLGEEILAGTTPTRALGPREAAAIMTGAPLPPEADAVVMIERTHREGPFVVFGDLDTAPGQNWLLRGSEMKAGDLVLERGQTLNAPKLGILAAVGRSQVQVIPRPRVAVLTTGDELVEPSQRPGPGQIRNSNATLLHALAASAGVEVEVFPNAPDEIGQLKRSIAAGLSFDVLLITGGVSAGNRDLVPSALEALGVERVFHKVRLKPGKPLWFGKGPARENAAPGALVFGLPGNPVSGLVGFLVLVRPAMRRLAGLEVSGLQMRACRLVKPFRQRGDRDTYHPARWQDQSSGDVPAVELVPWAGSSDLKAVAAADGFAVFPAGERDYLPDEIVAFLPFD